MKQQKPASALRLARVWRGFTIQSLRDATTISTGRISMLERELVQPNALERRRLSEALQLPVHALFPATLWPSDEAELAAGEQADAAPPRDDTFAA